MAVMPAPVAGIHVFLDLDEKTWMAGTSPAMTKGTAALALPARLRL